MRQLPRNGGREKQRLCPLRTPIFTLSGARARLRMLRDRNADVASSRAIHARNGRKALPTLLRESDPSPTPQLASNPHLPPNGNCTRGWRYGVDLPARTCLSSRTTTRSAILQPSVTSRLAAPGSRYLLRRDIIMRRVATGRAIRRADAHEPRSSDSRRQTGPRAHWRGTRYARCVDRGHRALGQRDLDS